jgi:RNA polymerase sigma-70 factor (ECF subfamily)
MASRPERCSRSELARIEQALARLPSTTREAFFLCRLNYLDYTEVAERLGITVRNVEKSVATTMLAVREARKGTAPCRRPSRLVTLIQLFGPK